MRALAFVRSGNESDLAAAIGIRGPVAASVDATYFENYRGGVLNVAGSCVNLNHAVTIVGYGRDARGGDYWLAKNSWGAQWAIFVCLAIRRISAESPPKPDIPSSKQKLMFSIQSYSLCFYIR